DVVDEPHRAQPLGELRDRRGLAARPRYRRTRLREESGLGEAVVFGDLDLVALALVRVLVGGLLERPHGPAPAGGRDAAGPRAGAAPQALVERAVAARELHVREHHLGALAEPRRDARHLPHVAA